MAAELEPFSQKCAIGHWSVQGADRAWVPENSPALQLPQLDQPDMLNRPGGHTVSSGVVDAIDGHTYPALQLAQLDHPDTLYRPGGHGPMSGLVLPVEVQVNPALQLWHAAHPLSLY